jgi:hypothetical protein
LKAIGLFRKAKKSEYFTSQNPNPYLLGFFFEITEFDLLGSFFEGHDSFMDL